MRRRPLLAAAGSAAATGLAGCLGVFGTTVSESFENTYEVTDETTLAVTNRNGPVTVRDTDADRLTVSGEKRAGSETGLDEISVGVTEGEQFSVDVSFGSGSAFDNRRVDLVVEVPEGVTVDRAATANGTVTVDGVRGDVSAVTSNGDVTVDGVDGYVRAESSNGNVRVDGATGLAGARTSNGVVDVELLGMRADVTCRSTNGEVTVRVGPDVSVGFSLSTSNGEASVVDLPYTASTSRRGLVEGQLRGGTEPVLTAETTNGDVTLRPVDGG